MEFSAKKCHVLVMGESTKRLGWVYKMGTETFSKVKEEKDLVVIMQRYLLPEKYINKIIEGTLLTNMTVDFF